MIEAKLDPKQWKSRLVICDLDGTLFDSRHRDHLAQAKKWENFHEASINDPLNEDVAKFIDRATYFCDSRVIFLTGCNERFRRIKTDLLRKHHLHIGALHMRSDNDWRPDVEVKPEMLKKVLGDLGLDKDAVWLILEDRDKVVAKWRELGYNCWQPRAGTY